MKFILVTKEIRFYHLKVLLTSLNICSYRTDELGNGIGSIYYIVLSETRKNWVLVMKIFNIVVLKSLDATSRGSLKLTDQIIVLNFPTYPSILRLYLPWFVFMKRIKIPPAESCAVIWRHHCLHKKLAILYLYDYVKNHWVC